MAMTKNFANKYLFSTVGIAAALVLIVAANLILRKVSLRQDFTSDKLYSLSEGTKNILAQVKNPVTMRFYCSQKENRMPVGLKTYAQRIEDLLHEYVIASKGKVVVERFDPAPDSDAEDSASLDGVEGQMIRGGEKFYLGLAVSCNDKNLPIPFFNPRDEQTLEYDITRAVYEVTHPKKPVIGVVSQLPLMGGASPQQMMMMQQRQSKPPWIFIQELKRTFDVREIKPPFEKVDDDVNVLLVVHPKGLTQRTLYAIDQYLLKGGKLMAFLDPYCFADSDAPQQAMFGQAPPPGASDLPELLTAWGLQFSKAGEVVVVGPDSSFQNMRDIAGEQFPSILNLTQKNMDAKDVILKKLGKLNMIFSGAFTGDPAAGLKKSVLLKTSTESDIQKFFTHMTPGSEIMKNFKAGGKELALAVRLEGKFKTAYPNGRPPEEEKKDKKGDKKAEEAKDPAKDAKPEDSAESIKESQKDGVVMLFGDADMLFDQFCVQSQKIFNQTIIQPLNDNLNLVQNATDQLSGDVNLISIRCRNSANRPFELVDKMRAEAQKKFQQQISVLEDELRSAEQRINSLQKNKSKDQQYILSPEQVKELKDFQEKEAKAKKTLKEVRKKLRKEIDNLELFVECVNIGLMPLLVIGFGVSMALFIKRRSKSA